MKLLAGVLMSVALGAQLVAGLQNLPATTDTPEAHVALAKAAAGDTYQNLFTFLAPCPLRAPEVLAAADREPADRHRARPRATRGMPNR